MLPKSLKLNSRQHSILIKQGKRKHKQFFTLQFLRQVDSKTYCAVVVPKKIYKKAIKRNENRRKVFDIIKNIYPQLKQGYFLALILRKNIEGLDKEALEQEIQEILIPVLR